MYWITQHKDWGKGKNRPTLKTTGMGHGERSEVGRDERSGIICRREIFDRKPYIVPNRIMVKCGLRDVIYTFPANDMSCHFSSIVLLDPSHEIHRPYKKDTYRLLTERQSSICHGANVASKNVLFPCYSL